MLDHLTQPLAVAASAYDDTNNHVLHTLLVWVAHQFGGWNRIALRMPAFLSFCLLLPALWWFVRREYGPTAALFATAFASTSPFFVNLATNARGYTLIMLLFVVALLCGQALVRSPDRKALWAAWAGALALGFYTVPLMAFSAATAVAWMLIARWRRCGNAGLPSFAARTAAWSVAALAVAVALYLPVFLAGGLASARTVATTSSKFVGSAIELAAHPLVLWGDWQWALPGWAQAALLALVVAGATARGRSCGRRGTLLLATGAAWAPMVAHPLLLEARMAVWTLLVCCILAGAGAALVLDGAVAQARARWPTVVTGPRRRGVQCVALALVLASCWRWSAKPENWITSPNGIGLFASPSALAMTLSTAGQMQPGDYLGTCKIFDSYRQLPYIMTIHPVLHYLGNYNSGAVDREDSALKVRQLHRVGTADEAQIFSRLPPQRALPLPWTHPHGRLFLFGPHQSARCDPPALFESLPDVLEAQWPNHELVATFANEGTFGGTSKVYVLHKFAPSKS